MPSDAGWTPAGRLGQGPLYRAIADAIASDIANGLLRPGDRLPTHRALAQALGVDLTTVTRAYGEARERGLIDAAVGRGTFIRDLGPAPVASLRPVELDLSMNLPPQPPVASIQARLARTLAAVTQRPDLSRLLNYQPIGGAPVDRAAGAAWLAPLLPGLASDRVLLVGGAQAGLAALLTLLVPAGRRLLTGCFTYPGLRAAADALGIAIEGVEMDGEGVCPAALDRACTGGGAAVLYLSPTIQNPTSRTAGLERRMALLAVARRHGLCIIEDDAYGRLPPVPVPPLAHLAPDLVWYVATLAKGLTPGLRLAYLVAPDAARAQQARTALRAVAQMAPPLSVAVATAWIQDGTAETILTAIRAEAMARQELAATILPADSYEANPAGHHVWLCLPPGQGAADFVEQARRTGLGLVAGSAFTVGQPMGEHVRIALGAAPDRQQLTLALERIADLLAYGPAPVQEIV